MKAIRVETHGGRDVLRYMDVPEPKPDRGHALVQIEAAGVNFIDVYHRKGVYTLPTPFTLGVEGAGTVLEVGPDVHDIRVGDRVACGTKGFRAPTLNRAIVPAERLVRLPHHVSTRDAAALMLQGLTAALLGNVYLRTQRQRFLFGPRRGWRRRAVTLSDRQDTRGARHRYGLDPTQSGSRLRCGGGSRDRVHRVGFRSRNTATDRWPRRGGRV